MQKDIKKIEEYELYIFDMYKKNDRILIGVDEVGRGPLAGDVVASAVLISEYQDEMIAIKDSKKLSEKKRRNLFNLIKENSFFSLGFASPYEIDELNILNATFLAMNRAVNSLIENLEKIYQDFDRDKVFILVDGNKIIKNCNFEQECIVGGDNKSLSIAAASIMAKVTRDEKISELDNIYKDYYFKDHKGYGTKKHREVILEKGAIEGVHRKSFLKKLYE